MSEQQTFSVKLKNTQDYQFMVDFGDFGQLLTDEPSPLGEGKGPNPARLLIASVANCLCASLLFAVKKYHQEPGNISAEVTGTTERVDKRWRITKIAVALTLGNKPENIEHFERIISQFEDFCVVTQSVRRGIEVTVDIFDQQGKLIS
jgi:organic hydroperoxide reductase OsmC/OhrA